LAVFAELVQPGPNRSAALTIFNSSDFSLVQNISFTRRWTTALVFNQTTALVIGGANADVVTSSAYWADLKGTESSAFTLTTPRMVSTCVVVGNNRILITGGFKDWSRYSSVVY